MNSKCIIVFKVATQILTLCHWPERLAQARCVQVASQSYQQQLGCIVATANSIASYRTHQQNNYLCQYSSLDYQYNAMPLRAHPQLGCNSPRKRGRIFEPRPFSARQHPPCRRNQHRQLASIVYSHMHSCMRPLDPNCFDHLFPVQCQ